MFSLKIGPAGNAGKDIFSSLTKLSGSGLQAQEVEFVRGVVMSNETAKKVGEEAKKLGIQLSIHAPYYINLASEEKPKIEASKKRILDSCERGFHMGARYVVFHPAYYGKKEKDDVYKIVKEAIVEMQDSLKKDGFDAVRLAPETTGKKTQFGSLDELLRLRKETGCSICVDFAHLLARDGSVDYRKIFWKLSEAGIKTLHSHFSGIEFTEKGERRHLLTEEDEIKKLLDVAKDFDIEISLINESPQPFEDAMKTKKIYDSLY